jgi:hypothetical protein
MQGKGFREDARRVLRAAYEQQAARGGTVTHVDLGAGAEEYGMGSRSVRLAALVDFMEVMMWVKTEPFARTTPGYPGAVVRRITARGRQVLYEDAADPADGPRLAVGDSDL